MVRATTFESSRSAASAYFFQDAFRISDFQLRLGELLPRDYYPTGRSFPLHKPGVSIAADVYGWFYHPAMLRSPTLVGSVLERRHVEVRIDRHGFRETSSLEASRISALGDSFTFGTGTTPERTWPEALERRLGEPVCNLGHNASSPRRELLLLDHLFEADWNDRGHAAVAEILTRRMASASRGGRH